MPSWYEDYSMSTTFGLLNVKAIDRQRLQLDGRLTINRTVIDAEFHVHENETGEWQIPNDYISVRGREGVKQATASATAKIQTIVLPELVLWVRQTPRIFAQGHMEALERKIQKANDFRLTTEARAAKLRGHLASIQSQLDACNADIREAEELLATTRNEYTAIAWMNPDEILEHWKATPELAA